MMKNKILLLLLVVLIPFNIYFYNSASAAGFVEQPNDKFAKIVKSVGQRMGINWTGKSLSTMVGAMYGADLTFWSDWASTKDSIPLDSNPDYSQYTLSPEDFKTISDGIIEAKGKIYEGNPIPFYGFCSYGAAVPISNGQKVFSFTGGTNNWLIVYSGSTSQPTWATAALYGGGNYPYPNPTLYLAYTGATKIYQLVSGSYSLQKSMSWESGGYFPEYGFGSNEVSKICGNSTITGAADQVADYTNIVNDFGSHDITIITNNNDTYNNIDNGSDTTIYNPPITNVVVDTDGDGIPDDRDSTPTKQGDGSSGTNPFASLVPIIFLIKLFGLLGACLSYVGRLLAFVMTIPVIPPKTIDNSAFQWFRDASIVGIHIYTVVTSMASIGLSFLVYRVIRRLF